MFSYVANHLWQSTLFAGVIGLLCQLLRKEGAQVRYWLWWVASAKFLVPFALLVQIGSLLAPESAPIVISETWAIAIEAIAMPVDDPGLSLWLGLTLLVFWAIGFAAYIVRWTASAARINSAVRRAKYARTVEGGNQMVAVYHSNDMQEPGIVGLFRPVLLIPHCIDDVLSETQLAAVAAHELCHVKRRDNLTAVSHMIAEAVFWFYLPVWLIGARLVAERERACDEAVIAQGHCRESYAEGILKVCEHFVKSPLTSSAGVSGGDLSKRVTHIIRSQAMRNLGVTKKMMLTAAAICMAGIPILVGYADQPAEERNKDILPIEREAPTYPAEALEQGLNGHVDLVFTITPQGTTKDIKIISSTSPLFDESAMQALAKFKYEPVTRAIPNVRTRIAYRLKKDTDPQDE